MQQNSPCHMLRFARARAIIVTLAMAALHSQTPATQAQTPSENCAQAPVVGPGTYVGSPTSRDGSGSCPGEGLNPWDCWVRYIPASTGVATISVCNQGPCSFAMVSVHTGCPGTSANQIECAQAGLSNCPTAAGPIVMSVTANTSYYVRAAGCGNGVASSLQITISYTPSPRTHFVDANLTTGANNGTSWGNAYRGVLGLLNAINAANTGDAIWAADGLYRATTGTDRTATITVDAAITMLGGFAGGESNANNRNPAANATVIGTNIGDTGTPNDDQYHGLRINPATSGTVVTIDGFEFSCGTASGATGDNFNRSGAGVYADRGQITFTNCWFYGGLARDYGAGVFATQGSLTFYQCFFSGNQLNGSAGAGAAIATIDSRVTCHNSMFAQNSNLVGANVDSSGAVYMDNLAGNDSFINCTFWQNQTTAGHQAVLFAWQGPVIFRNNIVWDSTPVASPITVGGTLTTEYNDIQGGGYGGTGNINADPLFVGFGDWRLQAASPCVDSANNNHNTLPTDRAGYRRREDEPTRPDTGVGTPPIIDMGAFERQRDCDNDSIPDYVEISLGAPDCNTNLTPDSCEPGGDCNTNNTLDTCESTYTDCNTNATMDRCEFGDCNANQFLDRCETASPFVGSATHLLFDGVDDFVSLGTISLLNVGNTFSIEAWVRPASVTNPMRIISNRDPSTLGGWGLGFANNGRLRLTTFGRRDYDSTNVAATPGQWVHVAATLDAANTCRFYVNGQFLQSLTNASPGLTSTSAFLIGRNPGATPEYFHGRIDELRAYNNVRTETEIAASYAGQVGTTEPGLVAYYRMNEGVGPTLVDSAPNGGTSNGSIAGGTLWMGSYSDCNTNGSIDTCEAAADCNSNGMLDLCESSAPFTGFGAHLYFDGSNDYITVPGIGQSMPTQEITIELWQNVAASGLITFSMSPDIFSNRILVHAPWLDGRVYWDFGNAAGSGRLSYLPPVSILGSWQHFALVASQSQNEMRIYRNGVLEASKVGMSPFVRDAFDLRIAGLASGFYRGQIDEFRLWDVARTSQQIQDNFRIQLAGTEPGLLAYYRLNEGSGSATADLAADGGLSTGLLVGGPSWRNAYYDCNTNTTPDSCELSLVDCNTNGTIDRCDIVAGANDCNSDFIPDLCQTEADCNENGTPDLCEPNAYMIGSILPAPSDLVGNVPQNAQIFRFFNNVETPDAQVPGYPNDYALAFYRPASQKWHANPPVGPPNGNGVVRIKWRNASNQVLRVCDYLIADGPVGNPVGYVVAGTEYYLNWFRDLQNPPANFNRDIPLRTANNAPSYDVRIHYNGGIIPLRSCGQPDCNTNMMVADVELQQGTTIHFSPVCPQGKVVIEYHDSESLVGFEVLEIKSPAAPAFTQSFVGRRLTRPVIADDSKALMHRNSTQNGATAAWQRGNAPNFSTDIFPIRPEASETNFVVSWWHANAFGNIWPVAITRHRSNWPADPQLHVIDDPAPTPPAGSLVDLHARTGDLYCAATIMYQRTFADTNRTDSVINGGVFSATGPGRAVIRFDIQPENEACGTGVKFEVVESYDRTAVEVRPNGSAGLNCDVGTQLNDEKHDPRTPQPFRHGYLYSGLPYATNTYPYNGSNPTEFTGQIFPVNARLNLLGEDAHGQLEAWWYQQKTANVAGVFWPTTVVRYNPAWPTQTELILIARQDGAGPPGGVYPQTDVSVYNVGGFATRAADRTTVAGWNPNSEHARLIASGGGQKVFATRDDDNWGISEGAYALVRYRDTGDPALWRFGVHQVVGTLSDYTFDYSNPQNPLHSSIIAGTVVNPPYPINDGVNACGTPPRNTTITPISGDALWVDRTGVTHAVEAVDDVNTNISSIAQVNLFENWSANGECGCQAWRDASTSCDGTPHPILYGPQWPEVSPVCGEAPPPGLARRMCIGSSLTKSNVCGSILMLHNSAGPVRVLDHAYVSSVSTALPPDVRLAELPPHLIAGKIGDTPLTDRVKHVVGSPGTLEFTGIMNDQDRLLLKNLSQGGGNAAWNDAIDRLYCCSRRQLHTPLPAGGNYTATISVGAPRNWTGGSCNVTDPCGPTGLPVHPGWLTLAFGNDEGCGAVTMEVWRIEGPPAAGQVQTFVPQCVFNEKITLRFTGDCGGDPDALFFHWQYASSSQGPWQDFAGYPAGFTDGHGLRELTLEGQAALLPRWWRVRYRGYSSLPNTGNPAIDNPDGVAWPQGVGGIGTQISPFSAPNSSPGWIDRVVSGLNLFDQRYLDFHLNQAGTIVNMVRQAGKRYEGDVPLNCNDLNALDLIQGYETVLRRLRTFTIDASPPLVDNDDANGQVRKMASRISDLYMLLGNEAFADAADPTIGIFGGGYEGRDPHAIYSFQDQTGVTNLLDEELALLRGRDRVEQLTLDPITGAIIATVYNRLRWNFTEADGEVAYANNYQLTTESAARQQYPQGHGDAWGHYLTAAKEYYDLLKHPSFFWAIIEENVNGLLVSYQYERKFAKAVAAKARSGAEITALTFRQKFDADPTDQNGYPDANTSRAWGVVDWGRRAGQGTYFDWLTANALLDNSDDVHTNGNIDKVDRTTVLELGELVNSFSDIQNTLDQADAGVNPLGLASNVVPFGLNPSEIVAGRTHFDQIADRAVAAVNNAVTAFDYANQNTQRLREVQDQADEFDGIVADAERDFNARLIEIFGKPYPEDIDPIANPGANYPAGYDGPDILPSYDYVEPSALLGLRSSPSSTQITINFRDRLYDVNTSSGGDGIEYLGTYANVVRPATFNVSTEGFGLVKPDHFTTRPEPGAIQLARYELFQALGAYIQALTNLDAHDLELQNQADLLENLYSIQRDSVNVTNDALSTQTTLNKVILDANISRLALSRGAEVALQIGEATAEGFPTVVGTSYDATSVPRAVVHAIAIIASQVLGAGADVAEGVALYNEQQRDAAINAANFNVGLDTIRSGVVAQLAAIRSLIIARPAMYVECLTLRDAVNASVGRYQQAVGQGLRLLEQRDAYRAAAGSTVSTYRYRDMAFRIFRAQALQKYRAQFDLAARYVYLAAKAYDYETNRLGTNQASGRQFLANIVRERFIGVVSNGVPSASAGGLAGQLATLQSNFDTDRVNLNFNNPAFLARTFSLRWEAFRIPRLAQNDSDWRALLTGFRVENLYALQEFRQFCAPPSDSNPVNPAIVIPFSTTIQEGFNLFGWPSEGDATVPTNNFAIKIQTAGIRFENYNGLGLNPTPVQAYIVPVGSDVSRVPQCPFPPFQAETREWRLIDQTLPAPLPLVVGNPQTPGTLSHPSWMPWDNVSAGNQANGAQNLITRRLIPSLDACDVLDGPCDGGNTKLVGRSIWNTRWLLIVYGSALRGADRSEGVRRFIEGPSGGGGVTDIKIVTQMYGYSGCGGAPLMDPPDGQGGEPVEGEAQAANSDR